jgi:hypothetical protein
MQGRRRRRLDEIDLLVQYGEVGHKAEYERRYGADAENDQPGTLEYTGGDEVVDGVPGEA